MLFVWIALWMIAFILWIADWRRLSTRFAGATAFAGGAGGLAGTIDDLFVQPSPVLTLLETSSSLFSQLGLPYFFLMFALTSIAFRATRLVGLFALIPPAIVIWLTPIHPTYEYDFSLSLYWVGPYLLIGTIVLLLSWYRERNPVFKQVRALTNFIAIFPVLFNFVTSNVLRSLEYDSIWKWNALIIPVLFILFIIFGLKYGVLGIKLTVERYRMDSTMRVLTSGAAILNHTIKNELAKIGALLGRVEQHQAVRNEQVIQGDLTHIHDSLNHMHQMVERIRTKTQDITVKIELLDMHELGQTVIRQLQPIAAQQQVTIMNLIPTGITLQVDRVHVTEVLNNTLNNALEAFAPNANDGSIRITYRETKKESIIVVEDSGRGIPKEHLQSVLEPFFSTKNTKLNFGLGLSYCFQVMQAHGGSLHLHSEAGQGTSVFLHFPKKK
jgi:two-component system sporulation sensor kinase B